MAKRILMFALPFLAACSQQAEPAPDTPTTTLHQVMLAEIDEPADALWELTNSAIGDQGGLDPALMDDARWTRLAELADQVAAGSARIAAMDPIIVAPPGVAIGDSNIEGGHSAEQVQAAIDRDPAGMRALAESLGSHVGDLATAARAHDAATAGPLVDALDGVCESCHLQYWYPEQRELIEQFQNSGVVDPDHPALGPREAAK
jgi:hypothetical protein